MLISCPLTSHYTHAYSHYTFLFRLTLKTPHSCSQNVQLFLCFETAVIVTLLTQSLQCFSDSHRASPWLLLCPHTNTDYPLSVSVTAHPLSFHHSFHPSGHQLGMSRLDRTLSPTTMSSWSTTINFHLIAVPACMSLSVFLV